MTSSGFLPKKQASDWLIYLVYQLEACFFGGRPVELMTCIKSQKKLTLGFIVFSIFHIIIRYF